MANIGQTVIIRTDLFDLPQDMGLLAAQVAHIHMQLVRQMILDNAIVDDEALHFKMGTSKQSNPEDLMNWLDMPYLFVKKVPNAEALMHFQALAINAELPTRQWKDTVYVRMSPTMKQAFPDTLVGISIGPADADAIRTVVGDLPLL